MVTKPPRKAIRAAWRPRPAVVETQAPIALTRPVATDTPAAWHPIVAAIEQANIRDRVHRLCEVADADDDLQPVSMVALRGARHVLNARSWTPRPVIGAGNDGSLEARWESAVTRVVAVFLPEGRVWVKVSQAGDTTHDTYAQDQATKVLLRALRYL